MGLRLRRIAQERRLDRGAGDTCALDDAAEGVPWAEGDEIRLMVTVKHAPGPRVREVRDPLSPVFFLARAHGLRHP